MHILIEIEGRPNPSAPLFPKHKQALCVGGLQRTVSFAPASAAASYASVLGACEAQLSKAAAGFISSSSPHPPSGKQSSIGRGLVSRVDQSGFASTRSAFTKFFHTVRLCLSVTRDGIDGWMDGWMARLSVPKCICRSARFASIDEAF